MEQLTARRQVRRGFHLEWEHMRYAAFTCLFLMIWFFPNPNAVSFREDPGAGREGTLLVQLLWFGTLGFMVLNMQDRWKDVRQQFDATLFALLGWCLMTVPLAILPDVSMRRYIFTVVGILVAMLCVATPKRAESVLWLLLTIIVFETVTKYVFVFAFPSVGRHGFLLSEPQLNGLWRGQFAHKNVAGPVCVFELFIIYAARRMVSKLYLLLLAVPQLIFLVMSGSKTSLGLLLIVFVLTQVIVRSRSFFVTFLVFAGATATINALTVLSTLSYFFRDLASSIVGDITFTGRTDIWAILLRYIGEHPWIGAGFLSFWQIGALSPATQDGSTWAALAIYGHQGYLDMAATVGLPGLALTLLFMLLRPSLDISKIERRNDPMLAIYISFVLFGLLQNGTESTIMSRADGVWLFMVMGIAGIRRCRIEDRRREPAKDRSLEAAARAPMPSSRERPRPLSPALRFDRT